MFESQRSLASVQLSRNTLAEIAESTTPLREAALESFRRRNAVLDTIFYDVGKVTQEETTAISPWLAREGSLLIVPPTGQAPVRLCKDIDDFAHRGGRDIRVLTVAGVGSSALGSAAFARNIADAFGEPVAAVVSGYELADLITEAAGGWFWFGALNKLRHQFEQLDPDSPASQAANASLSKTWAQAPTATTTASPQASVGNTLAAAESIPLARISLDTKTTLALLVDQQFKFSLLTGHSKGNLVVSEALFELEKTKAWPLNGGFRDDAWIITVSAAVGMPHRYTNVIDVMGNIDWFGAVNSLPFSSIEKVCYPCWHHTNTQLLFHLPVTRAFQQLIETRKVAL